MNHTTITEDELLSAHDGRAPRVLSGMQPSADSLHLGNYLGALVNWVKAQEDYDSFYFIPDMHAITVPHDPADLAERTRRTVAQYIAGGIDIEKSTLFVQSHVPEHAQLAWIMMCLTGFGEASRMTQFKDKSAKLGSDSVGVGLFTYPMLMAADILLYNPDAVPVGDDQKQHVELARDLAQRFNHRFGETFIVPKGLIRKDGARIYDLQDPTSKMSKSASSPNGLINILDEPKVIAKRIKSAVTDAGTEVSYDRQEKPGVSNLLEILSTVSDTSVETLVKEFEGKMYGHLKVAVADAVVERLEPIRKRTFELLEDPAELDRLLARGAEKARAVAAPVLADVYKKVGFLAPAGQAL
ncbi:tryptophan--tRNA ligase [Arthrobacter sp. SW1]|uniref:tryptophan--tRNA ligase n=1 Tax=Arthrobacter sp. SW1 TaxID=1920889 RepID=UPI000877DCF1|nr:tryptophan--tRNA ligase [Arthrobacter sp. SW1]OFI37724.1 tryptophan--tRNA ligase [Arthrobacter sp. SW1]